MALGPKAFFISSYMVRVLPQSAEIWMPLQLQPVVISTFVGDSVGTVAGISIGRQCFVTVVPLVLKERGSFNGNGRCTTSSILAVNQYSSFSLSSQRCQWQFCT